MPAGNPLCASNVFVWRVTWHGSDRIRPSRGTTSLRTALSDGSMATRVREEGALGRQIAHDHERAAVAHFQDRAAHERHAAAPAAPPIARRGHRCRPPRAALGLEQQRDQRLAFADLSALDHVASLAEAGGEHFDPLVGLGPRRHFAQLRGAIQVHCLVAEAGGRPELRQLLEPLGAQADFFFHLAARAVLRRLAGIEPARGQLPHRGLHRVAVLPHQHDAAVGVDRQAGDRAVVAHDFSRRAHAARLLDSVDVERQHLAVVDAPCLDQCHGVRGF